MIEKKIANRRDQSQNNLTLNYNYSDTMKS